MISLSRARGSVKLLSHLYLMNTVPSSNHFRSNSSEYDGDLVSFLSGYHEMYCRENLVTVFRLCSLCRSNHLTLPLNFTIDLPCLTSDHIEFKSSVRCIQIFLSWIPYANCISHFYIICEGEGSVGGRFFFPLGRSSFMFISTPTIPEQTRVSLCLHCF